MFLHHQVSGSGQSQKTPLITNHQSAPEQLFFSNSVDPLFLFFHSHQTHGEEYTEHEENVLQEGVWILLALFAFSLKYPISAFTGCSERTGSRPIQEHNRYLRLSTLRI